MQVCDKVVCCWRATLSALLRLHSRDGGQDALEYLLVTGVLAVIIAGALLGLNALIAPFYDFVEGTIDPCSGGC
jgi:hypothetical protein